ncbi:glycosyl hydrolase family 8 [Kitasatospora phosalacinea]|uniref:glycosyl hydrolase family 8 n=1 Tax=Kitasatospora phosalacinea TaxID=2065 RepID=UPI00068D5959|nr:glycosyl hydrolase family 8 [Kitasatospora phosalacinea]
MNKALPPAGTTATRPLWRTALATATAGACLTLYGAVPQAAVADTLLTTVQAESMTKNGGCTSTDSTRTVYYCNNDSTSISYAFPQAGRYSITVVGASSQNSTAGISVYAGSAKVAALTFTGTSYTRQSAVFDVAAAGSQEIRLKLETDNGQNDTYVDCFELAYQGPTPAAPPAPVPPDTGAYASGTYRNLFKEMDPTITDAAVTDKLTAYWNAFFTGTDDTKRLYYPAGTNGNGALAYIKDTGNGDVRSEGMSYGMMIAVQMDKKAEFDALWNWAKSNMQHQKTARSGYFCWQASESGSCTDDNPATDGEEYFATALFFAGNRWGNGTGIFDYTAEANGILDTMLHKQDMNGGSVDSVTNMFDSEAKLPVFVPYGSAARFSDPSYVLPAFYELWSRWADGYQGNQVADRQFWHDAATAGRAFFTKTTNATTGLNPDYAEFTGAPNNTGNHGDFRFDAWRTAVNWSVDYAWWAADAGQKTLTDRLQGFFTTQGANAYVNQYSLSGTALSSDRSPGLIASNAAASLAAGKQQAWPFVQALWNLQPPTGQYRYYDGLLNFMALLHTSGNFRIYGPGTGGSADTTAPSTPGALTVTATTATTATLSWTASSDDTAVASYTAYTGTATDGASGCTQVTATSCTVAGLSPQSAYTFTVKARDAAGNTSAASNSATATTAAAANRSAYQSIEAETATATGATTRSDDGGTVVQLTGSGSSLALTDIDFGTTGAAGVSFRASTTTPGVNLQVRLGSPTASPACTVYPDSNGTWHTKSNTCYPKPAGVQTIYITATGPVAVNSLVFKN